MQTTQYANQEIDRLVWIGFCQPIAPWAFFEEAYGFLYARSHIRIR